MATLVIAEFDKISIKPVTLVAVKAALECGGEVHLLLLGEPGGMPSAEAAKIEGVAKVLVVEGVQLADGLAEELATQVVALASDYSHILAAATAFGKNLLPRVAAILDVAQISDVIRIVDPDTFDRPIYAGNAIARVRSLDVRKVLTVRTTAFAAAAATGAVAQVESVAAAPGQGKSRLVSRQLSASLRPELVGAKVIVSGGRGLGHGENYRQLLEPLADKLGAALGASRAAVDAGFVPNDYQVGQTGKIVAPQLYIAIGISGAIQHLAGMKDSKIIVAINKDAEAPIFQMADYGLVGDLFAVVPELVQAL